MRKIELLSPAKDKETGIDAINCGADAVYIGAQFSARAAAGNSIGEIAHLINYAHQYHARVYLAINTILFDHEIAQALSVIHKAYEAGIDALIIQDMGLLECDLPPLVLHASTQTDNRTVEKINFLEKAGFQRAVLARELSLDQIKNINENTNIELECFIHGSLCVSYSGRCYMSAFMTGRSANRGECIQACRLPFTLEDKDHTVIDTEKHFLSLKDLNRSAFIPDLIEAGVSSFKIEGRLKDKGYVKNITSFYRKLMDDYLEGKEGYRKASTGRSFIEFQPSPQKSFNRMSTGYHINGQRESIASFYTPKSIGEPLGEVVETNRNSIIIDTKEKIVLGDGLCFFNFQQKLDGFYVSKVEGNKIYISKPMQLKKGSLIFRNQDKHFEELLARDISRKIRTRVTISESGPMFEFNVTDEDNIRVTKTIDKNMEEAHDREKALKMLQDQFKKTGNTIFTVGHIEVDIVTVPFFQASVINKIRRDLLEELTEKRIKKHEFKRVKIKPNDFPYPEKTLTFEGNVVNTRAFEFYKRHGVEEIKKGFEIGEYRENVKVMTTHFCLLYELGMCPRHHDPGITSKPYYLKTARHTFRLEFDCKNCEMGVYTI